MIRKEQHGHAPFPTTLICNGQQVVDYATEILDGTTTDKSRNAEMTALTVDNIDDYLASLD